MKTTTKQTQLDALKLAVRSLNQVINTPLKSNPKEYDTTYKVSAALDRIIAAMETGTVPQPSMLRVERIYKIENNAFLKAFADITLDESILIKGIRVLNGTSGLFVSMPQEQAKDKRWYDSIKCLNQETKEWIEYVVLEAYYNEV